MNYNYQSSGFLILLNGLKVNNQFLIFFFFLKPLSLLLQCFAAKAKTVVFKIKNFDLISISRLNFNYNVNIKLYKKLIYLENFFC